MKIKSSRLVILIVLAFMETGCVYDLHKTISKSIISENKSFEIKKMVSGCCGCYAYYVNYYESGIIKEQFVVELFCKFYLPTKHIFVNDENAVREIKESYVGILDNDYEFEVSEIEKEVFKKLDSLYLTEYQHRRSRELVFSQITGYRKAKQNEVHPAFLEGLK